MSVPNTVDDLLGLIRKSGMVDEQKLNTYLQEHPVGRPGAPGDAKSFADQLVRDAMITEFQKEQFLLGKWRGFTIGKYKLLERVGVGGMGQVFLCEHLFMKRRVAIKVLPPAKAEQPAALGRFYREARAAGSLDHPNIVRTHDIDQDGNLHFIVMEYVDGTNLLDIVKRFGPMDIRRATHYIRQVAVGLDFAYRNGIIHRDVKPGNVLIDRRGTAKILDMGLARFYNDQADNLTVKYDDKIVLGTADYVAPEQVANSHGVDVRADIYALGASFYFLLAGHPPFPQGSVSQKLMWHRTKDPTPIRQIRPEVPEGLALLIQKMMAKDPNQRFQSPAEVAAELERWVPAVIPLPNQTEMPTLSPAAQDASSASSAEIEQPSLATPEPARAAAGASAKPYAATASSSSGARHFNAQAASPFGAQSGSSGPFAAAAGTRDVTRSGSMPPGGYRPAPPPGPFAAAHPQADIPTVSASSHDRTPADARAPILLPGRASVLGTANRPVSGARPKGQTYLIVGLLVLCALLASGMVFFGLMYLKHANPAG